MNQQVDNALGGYEESVASGVIGITAHRLDLANKDIEVYKAELERMDATIKQLVEALRPFALEADAWNDLTVEGRIIAYPEGSYGDRSATKYTRADLLRAKQALAALPEEVRG